MIRDNGGWDCFKMIEVEKYKCSDKREAEKREDEVMTELQATMNNKRAFTTEDNKVYKKKLYIKRKADKRKADNKTKVDTKRVQVCPTIPSKINEKDYQLKVYSSFLLNYSRLQLHILTQNNLRLQLHILTQNNLRLYDQLKNMKQSINV
jgi:hypothetical protein